MLPMSWMYVDVLRCSGWLSMLTDVLDVCRRASLSQMYFDAHWCTGCILTFTDVLGVRLLMSWMYVDAHLYKLMLTDVLDVCRRCLMSWMLVKTLRCTGCMLTLSDVLDVCWRALMSWIYVDAHWCSKCMLMLSDVLDVSRCSPMFWMYVNSHLHWLDVSWRSPMS